MRYVIFALIVLGCVLEGIEFGYERYREMYAKPIDEWIKPYVDVEYEEMQPLMPLEYREEERILGERLFNEPKLSKSKQIACANCHNRELGFGDGLKTSFGHDRVRGNRNAPNIMMSGFFEKLFWDGRADSLESQVLDSLQNPIEMANTIEDAVSSIREIEDYYPLFLAAFGELDSGGDFKDLYFLDSSFDDKKDVFGHKDSTATTHNDDRKTQNDTIRQHDILCQSDKLHHDKLRYDNLRHVEILAETSLRNLNKDSSASLANDTGKTQNGGIEINNNNVSQNDIIAYSGDYILHYVKDNVANVLPHVMLSVSETSLDSKQNLDSINLCHYERKSKKLDSSRLFRMIENVMLRATPETFLDSKQKLDSSHSFRMTNLSHVAPLRHVETKSKHLRSEISLESKIKKIDSKLEYAKSLITMDNIAKAISTYERSLVPRNSRFNQFLNGKYEALTDKEIYGLHIFRTKGRCMNCHNGMALSDGRFHNIGLSFYGRKLQDLGRYEVSKNIDDLGKFKTPSLIAVSKSAPYMHNGIFPTIRGVLNMYNAGFPTNTKNTDTNTTKTSPLIKPLNLSKEEIEALESFLLAI